MSPNPQRADPVMGDGPKITAMKRAWRRTVIALKVHRPSAKAGERGERKAKKASWFKLGGLRTEREDASSSLRSPSVGPDPSSSSLHLSGDYPCLSNRPSDPLLSPPPALATAPAPPSAPSSSSADNPPTSNFFRGASDFSVGRVEVQQATNTNSEKHEHYNFYLWPNVGDIVVTLLLLYLLLIFFFLLLLLVLLVLFLPPLLESRLPGSSQDSGAS